MKIRSKKRVGINTYEYFFEIGCWASVTIPSNGDEGSWEYRKYTELKDSYRKGGLWFDDVVVETPQGIMTRKQLVDYDGCYELPYAVIVAVEDVTKIKVDFEVDEEIF